MELSVLWSGLVSQGDALHRANLNVPFPLGQNCPKTIAMSMSMHMSTL